MKNFDSSNLESFRLDINQEDGAISLEVTFNYGPTYRYWCDDQPLAAAIFYCAMVEAVDSGGSVGKVFNKFKDEFQYEKSGGE